MVSILTLTLSQLSAISQVAIYAHLQLFALTAHQN